MSSIEYQDVVKPEFKTADDAYNWYSQVGVDFNSPESRPAVAEIVNKLNPTIDYTLSSLGSPGDPVLRNHAKLILADSVKSYKPDTGASIATYANSQLRKLNRVARDRSMPIRIPERQYFNQAAINEAREYYLNEKGKNPTVTEISAYTGLSPSVILKSQDQQVDFSADSAADSVAAEVPDFFDTAVEYVMAESDRIDHEILEHTLGLNGKPRMGSQELANGLGISQSQVSRRMARLMANLHQYQDLLAREAGLS